MMTELLGNQDTERGCSVAGRLCAHGQPAPHLPVSGGRSAHQTMHAGPCVRTFSVLLPEASLA